MSNKLFEIKFTDEKDISVVQLLRAGVYDYYGDDMEITADDLRHMKQNFDNNVKKVDLAIDYYHQSYSDAAGWIKEVILKNKDTELWVRVEWTERGRKKILSKELRYLSVEFDPSYKDNETGEKFGITLCGGGLTNRPFVKGMNPILHEISGAIDKCPEKLDDIKRIISNNPEKEHIAMDFAELKKELVSITLSDANKNEILSLIGMADKTKTLSEKVKSLTDELKTKDDKIIELSEKLLNQDKEVKFNEMLASGKAVPAQKEAFMTGDVIAFADQAVDVNLKAKGSGNGDKAGDDSPKTFEEASDKVIKLTKEKMAKDSSLTFDEAGKIVLSENPALEKLMG